MTYTVLKLEKMRAGARERVLASDPELRKAWEEAQAKKTTVSNPKVAVADKNGKFTFQCSECGNVFKAYGKYAECPCCGEDTSGMVHLAYKF